MSPLLKEKKQAQMQPNGDTERLLVRYLLGDLDETEQSMVEDRAFADPNYVTEIEAAEADLIDAYVKGELTPPERAQFERLFLESPARRSKVEFAATLARRPRSPGWREVIADAPHPFPPDVLTRIDELSWRSTPFQGIQAKILFSDRRTGSTTSLLRMQPGASYPPHHHAADEHMFVLEGDLQFADYTMYAGEHRVAAGDSSHSAATTRAGCMVLLMYNAADRLLPLAQPS